ncbi:ComEC/Rec2 family competence protein [Sphingomonas sp. IC081]|uniref:ComEC/Rec2 family competence protein n=1 Tax=Sphingomonas sp. IC081 TaxID=304378 RepID=UPI0011580909|nr:ComEC/Rec2 family competence protein [Sphingomonas sp. IC081]QDK32724.1 metal-binding protein [Sphingomonas sp. IC081]
MASQAATTDDPELPTCVGGAALQHRPWISQSHMSSRLDEVECFLSNCGFDRGPWLVAAFGTGILCWFTLPGPAYWIAFSAICVVIGAGGAAWREGRSRYPFLRRAAWSLAVLILAGFLVIWGKSALVGTAAISRPISGSLVGRVLSVEEQPAFSRDRLVLAMREPGTGRAIKVRVNVSTRFARNSQGLLIAPGALIRFHGRLIAPAPPMFPGGYDFARAAWFSGLSATGSVTAPIVVLAPGTSESGDRLARWRSELAGHVRSRLAPAEAGIAVALVTGDMGSIGESDARAMRDSGLAHLLSISGLHVSAVIGAVYVVILRLLALFPAVALRVRLPVAAAVVGALAGIGYTVLTGSQVPTVRSCAGALLVLTALALGREALSVRLLAAAAFAVMLFWPESIVGPSFQMSFAAVLALIVVGNAGPIQRMLSPRDDAWPMKLARALTLMLVTGVAIECVLMPIGLYHFHRAGVYGALANLVAIPLTTFVIMPLVAFSLLLDLAGVGEPVWWLSGEAISMLLALARNVAHFPGAVSAMPRMGGGHFLLFVIGGLWFALWSHRVRFWGVVPAVLGLGGLLMVQPPDIMVSGDGRHVALVVDNGSKLAVLRDGVGDYARDSLVETAGLRSGTVALQDWSGARCNADFCLVTVEKTGRIWRILLSRNRAHVPLASLARACAASDIVIADRYLPPACSPRWLKFDRQALARTGGVTVDLGNATFQSVAQEQGQHGWWRTAQGG